MEVTDTMFATAEKITDTDLWKEYEKTRSPEVRNELVMRHTGLVYSIVRRISCSNYDDTEDLTSYGMLGLIEAVEKFKPNQGVAFDTFATYRIRGEIIDYIRRNDWVPRNVRKRAIRFENDLKDFSDRLGRRPTDTEIMREFGIEEPKLKQIYSDIDRFNVFSFEDLLQSCTPCAGKDGDSQYSPEGALQEKELTEVLSKAIEEMPERERLIITLYYYEEFSLKEISGILGVSESRVSQLHSKAIKRMKKTLQAYANS